MPAPPASLPDAGHDRTNHAYDSNEPYYGEEPSEHEVCEDNPIEWLTGSVVVSVKSFSCHFLVELVSMLVGAVET